jgi:hypothetical protein
MFDYVMRVAIRRCLAAPAERTASLEILRDTKPELPDYWM